MSKFSSAMRFDVGKFDGRINFGLWQVQVKDVLIQFGLYKALRGRPVSSGELSSTSKNEKEWDDLDLRAANTIRLCLAKNVLANVHGISTAKELWEKLKQLYQGKDISNRLYLKEQFHTLRMDGDTKISDHLSILNNIVSKLEAIRVKMEDENKTLRLVLSLPSSYKHMKPILMYGKETLKFTDVTSKLLSEEKRMEGSNTTSSEGTVLVTRQGKKKNSGRNLTCWKCGQSGHVKSIAQVEWARLKTPNKMLTMSPFSWGTMSSVEIWENTSSWYFRFTMERDMFILAVPRIYTCVLVWQGCKVCGGVRRWLMNIQVNQTRKLHHKIFSKLFRRAPR